MNPLTTYVYESPDGGHTVYRRESGSTQRELHSISDYQLKVQQQLKREELWQGILDCAEHNAELGNMLEQIEIYYSLKHL
jgi:hypothetical protein